ncbi:unnamed protein product [Prunus armeniaca]|uniref:S-protein homolog n=1 Tax=Prunus armeniaca TaxID=36596 RepID=A0A6J5TDC4_PRUAR|nr:unnamed protein product [Prunus armeniaca]
MASLIRNELLIVPVLFLTMCHADGKTTVRTINNLGAEMTIHCKSKDDDLGIHVVPVGGSYEFSFRPNIFGRTLFFCSFAWATESHYFDIYKAKREFPPWHDRTWSILPSGPCMWNYESSQYDICYQWNKD